MAGNQARSNHDSARPRPLGEKVTLAALIALVAGLCILTLRPFAIPFAWGLLLAFITWPAYARLHRAIRRPNLAAFAMLLIVAAVTAVLLYGLSMIFSNQLAGALNGFGIKALSREGVALIEALRALPWIGNALADAAQEALSDPGRLIGTLGAWLRQWLTGGIVTFAGNVGSFLLKFGIMLLALFFLYRDGSAWWQDIRAALERLLAQRASAYIDSATKTVEAVLYGLLGGAAVQGVAAGVGYWLVGAPAPMVLAVLTAVVSILPYGTVLAIVPVSAWLAATGALWPALALLVWGAVVVGLADNLARPLFISRVGHVHLLLATLGVLGGVGAFGLIGVFVGPVALAIVLAGWREWLAADAQPAADTDSEPVPALLTADPPDAAGNGRG